MTVKAAENVWSKSKNPNRAVLELVYGRVKYTEVRV